MMVMPDFRPLTWVLMINRSDIFVKNALIDQLFIGNLRVCSIALRRPMRLSETPV